MIKIIVLVSVFVCVFCAPRDSTVVQRHEIALTDCAESHEFSKAEVSTEKPAIEEVKIPGRVACEYEEATEDDVCKEHCLPKGYNYGICVSRTCSCI